MREGTPPPGGGLPSGLPTGRLPRPRVGVVLAAGRSERLRAVTGGGSKALVRLGGLRLVERAVRTLLAAGLERVVVVVGYHAGPVAAVAGRAAPGRVQVVEAAGWETGNAASLLAAETAIGDEPCFLAVGVDHLFSTDALGVLASAGEPALLVDPVPDPAIRAEATKVRVDRTGGVEAVGKDVESRVVGCGAHLLPLEAFDAARGCMSVGEGALDAAVNRLASEVPVRGVALSRGAWWRDIDTPEDLAEAGRLLRGSLGRPEDGPVSRLLNRRISIPISWTLARLRPSPDLLSALVLLVGVVAALLLGAGVGVPGGILAQACSILDGVDGEVARLLVLAGPRGTLLDGFLDRLGDAAICVGLAVWAVNDGSGTVVSVALAVAATSGAMLSMATKDRVAALGLDPPSERRIGWLLGGRDGRLLLVAVLSILGQPLAALAVTAATSLVSATIRVLFARSAPTS